MKVFGFNALFTFPVWMNKIVGLLMFNSWIFHRVCHVLVQSICGKNKN